MHYRTFNNIPGFHPLDDSTLTSPTYDNQKSVQTLPNIPWRGQNSPAPQESLF